MHYTIDNIPDDKCVGHQPTADPTMVWFETWFIEQGVFIAHKCKYIIDYSTSYGTVRKEYFDGRTFIWVLTGERDWEGNWLGVWPD